jgi:hypothetical protein
MSKIFARTYQTYDYAEEKRDAWNKLGIRLQELVPQLVDPEPAKNGR